MRTKRGTRGPWRGAIRLLIAAAAVLWGSAYIARRIYPPTPTPAPREAVVRAQEELLDVAVAPYDPAHAQRRVDRGDVLVVPLAEKVLDAPAKLACARPTDLEWIRPLRGEGTP